MKRLYGFLLSTLLASILTSLPALAGVANYTFRDTDGSRIQPEGTPTEISFTAHSLNGFDDNTEGFTPSVPKGDPAFTFYINDVGYTRFSVSTNGLVGFGDKDVSADWVNNLIADEKVGGSGGDYAYTLAQGPWIAPFWDDERAGSVSYFINGKAPKRVLVINYTNSEIVYRNLIYGSFQVRLYEGSNRIEFWYDDMSLSRYYVVDGGATIGIAANDEDFLSVTPGNAQGSEATVSSTEANNHVDISPGATPIYYGTLYIFDPCTIQISGDAAQGGTILMNTGDDLLTNQSKQVWMSTDYKPFSLYLSGDPCSGRTYTYQLSGSFPGDYTISPSKGTLGANETTTPTLTFTPKGVGPRPATLTVTDDNGFSRTYDLVGVGTTRINWIGNVAGGGVEPPASGSVFANAVRVRRLQTQNFTPLTIQNFNNNASAPGAPVTFTLVDPTNQYKIINPSTGNPVNTYTTSLTANQSITPTIRFIPTGVGPQEATLRVTAEGETRTYTFNAYSAAAGADFLLGTEKLGPTSQIFQKDFLCAGEFVQSYPITVKNVGDGDFQITGVDAYLTDTTYGQGTPSYPLRRDGMGNPIPAADYFISEFPAAASSNPSTEYPIIVPERGSRTIYINYVPQMPGKRFARIFVRTNGENFEGTNPNGTVVNGLLTVDLFGRGLGASISADRFNISRPKPLSFQSTPVNSSRDMSLWLYNPTGCDLRIDQKMFRITSGDVRDFKIMRAFETNVLDQSKGTYVVPPGDSTQIVIRFTPTMTGSRRATIMLQTNDSTLYIPGFTERGVLYWDVNGIGTAGFAVKPPTFLPGLIDGQPSDNPTAPGHLENNMRQLLIIDSMRIEGTDGAEFTMNPAAPWPATPFAVQPGQVLDFSVLFTPAPGSQPGTHSAQILLFTGRDTIFVPLSALAGTRTISLNPTSMFENTTVTLGKSAMGTLMITNTGTVPLNLGTTVVTGATPNDYIPGKLPRLVLAPGQTEYLEVIYRPKNRGTSSGTLTINSNATNGTQTVVLGGTATSIRPTTGSVNAVSGVEMRSVNGNALWPSVPNPARDQVEIRYELAGDAEITLAIYDATGNRVKVVESGSRTAGEHAVRVDVGDLASGVYHYRLETGTENLTRSLNVVK